MKENLKIKSSRLLLVEGNDEYWFCIQLLQFLQLNQKPDNFDIQVIDIEGKDNFAPSLELLTKHPDFSSVRTIGFIRDAEENLAQSSYNSICSAVKNYINEFPIPSIGKMKTENGFSCGIFIMPDNKGSGMLENLCIESVKPQPLYRKVESYVNEARQLLSESDKKKHNKPKAMVQTYLAGQPLIVNTLANAAKKNVWDFANPAFTDIVNFVKILAES